MNQILHRRPLSGAECDKLEGFLAHADGGAIRNMETPRRVHDGVCYLRSGAVEPKFKVPDRPSNLDPFADRLAAWLLLCGLERRIASGMPRRVAAAHSRRWSLRRARLSSSTGVKTGR